MLPAEQINEWAYPSCVYILVDDGYHWALLSVIHNPSNNNGDLIDPVIVYELGIQTFLVSTLMHTSLPTIPPLHHSQTMILCVLLYDIMRHCIVLVL